MGLRDAVEWVTSRIRRTSTDGAPGSDAGADETTSARGGDELLRRYADHWERTERGMGRYVVYPPTDGPSSVRRCETRDEVRRRLELWYGDGE